jgi:hypothetical protein
MMPRRPQRLGNADVEKRATAAEDDESILREDLLDELKARQPVQDRGGKVGGPALAGGSVSEEVRNNTHTVCQSQAIFCPR